MGDLPVRLHTGTILMNHVKQSRAACRLSV